MTTDTPASPDTAPPNASEHADAIVVGSGFGGSVFAARLAQAGLSVVVLERGRRWPTGSFPRSSDLGEGWFWQAGAGLYDIRWLDKMLSVHGTGWGGGSLVYANVFARPHDPSLSERWPRHLRRSQLDPYYDLAAHMLEVAPVGHDPRTGRDAPRTALVEDLIARMDRTTGTIRPNLAVRFSSDPDTPVLNRHGVAQLGCDFVGECVIGCNRGAKNSLDHNYLAVAERAGARAITLAEVFRIEPHPSGYAVSWRDPIGERGIETTMTAARVFLAAGAVGSTELLLRQRDVLGTMPRLSPRLGHGFSGNGDFLATAAIRWADGDLTRGPTITTTTVLDVPERRRPVWFQVQDGGIPAVLQRVISESLPLPRARALWNRWRGTDDSHRMALLTMGRDSGMGQLVLDRKGRAVVRWNNRREALLYRAQARVNPLLSKMLRTRVHAAPTWTLLRRAVTVHSLGGVPADRPGEAGVVDEWGEVHGYPGLYVVDGATIPAATGVNPSATILAAAERGAEHVARTVTGDEGWYAPEWSDVVPTTVPEDEASAAMEQWHAYTSGDGVRFRERMRTPSRARSLGPAIDLRLEVSFPGFDAFVADSAHALGVTGTITLDGVATDRPTRGSLSLFPEGEAIAMRYDLAFDDDTGAARRLSGYKAYLRNDPVARWYGLTRLRWELEPAALRESPPVRGVAAIGFPAALRLLGSIRGEAFTAGRRVSVVMRFASFFGAGALARGTMRS